MMWLYGFVVLITFVLLFSTSLYLLQQYNIIMWQAGENVF